MQLRKRVNDVEEASLVSKTKLVRLRRGVEKLRLERAFLLEQLHKSLNTSNTIEDSEGSPSPPPTVCTPFSMTKTIYLIYISQKRSHYDLREDIENRTSPVNQTFPVLV